MCCHFKIGRNLNRWPVWIGRQTQRGQKASRAAAQLASTTVQNVQIQGEKYGASSCECSCGTFVLL